MIQTIYNYIIDELIPSSKKSDPETEMFMKVVKETLDIHLIENIQYIIFTDNIDDMIEPLVDLAAEELHVDYYDYNAPIEQKRNLVKTTFDVHMKKGTKYAVEKVLDIFYENSTLSEWFEYNGTPGTFKINVPSDGEIDYSEMNKVIQMVDQNKRKSQTLESIGLQNNYNFNIKAGMAAANCQDIKCSNLNGLINVAIGSSITLIQKFNN